MVLVRWMSVSDGAEVSEVMVWMQAKVNEMND